MVFIGAAILAVTGLALMDSLESDSERETLQTCLQETDHRISTVLTYSTVDELPCEGGEFVPDGQLYLVWHDDSGTATDLTEDYPTVNATLGAIEYAGADHTYAYQAGGSWKLNGDDARVLSKPAFEYHDELLINVVTITEDALSDTPQRLNREPDSDVAKQIRSAHDEAVSNGYGNLSLVIESDYHDAWERHLTSAMTNDSVSIDTTPDQFPIDEDRAVRVDITDVIEPEPAQFEIVEDKGFSGPSAVDGKDNVIVANPSEGPTGPGSLWLNASVEVKNVGDVEGTEEITFEVDGEEIDSKTETLDGGESTIVHFDENFGQQQATLALEYGEVYEYWFETESDDLNPRGSFYYAKTEGPHLIPGNANAHLDESSENVTVTADIHNVGATNATDESVELSLWQTESGESDPYNLGNENPFILENRAFGEKKSATWTIDASNLIRGEHAFEIEVIGENGSNTVATGDFNSTIGCTDDDDDSDNLCIESNTEVDVSVVGTEMSTSGSTVHWVPAFATIYTQPLDGESEPEPVDAPWHGENLNQFSDRLAIYNHSFTVDERISLMVKGESYLHCHSWSEGQSDGERLHRSCDTNQVDRSDSSSLVELTADRDVVETNVRVLSEKNNLLPNLDPGLDFQLDPQTLLEREEVGIEVTDADPSDPDNDSALLGLDENEYLFVFELTHHPTQHNTGPYIHNAEYLTADEYWDLAVGDEYDVDPNFNDMLVHVEINSESEADYGYSGTFVDEGGEPIDVSPGSSDGVGDGNGNGGVDIGVGSDELIIG
ncbi:DUF7289 family protein [Halovivax gelatinilyticus]|uniref:DUF7289 family protein n=1 Tax=Halovivax gelatinilyticus TaxID=2961597 RepID=UPI003CCDC146